MFPQLLLIHLPSEILTEIAFELSILQPLGPPFILLPLLLTCLRTYDVLDNAAFWSRIFRYKFDSGSIQRRALIPKPEQYVDQLVRYCRALQLLRVADRYAGFSYHNLEDLPDVGLEEALQTALLMMYEDDGKNSRQLLEWANLAPLLMRTIQSRSYEGSQVNNGWALETRFNACLLWLMWMVSSEESLRNLSEHERRHLITTILPFVLFPYRYPVAEAPPNYFQLPFLLSPDTTTPLTSTIQTAHGRYPVFPSSIRTSSEVHYSTSPIVTFPLVAPPAKLLYFALNEVTSVPIPEHLAGTREVWLARGNVGIAPTKDVLEEFNWGWYTRLPLGPARTTTENGVENSWRWEWGLEGDIPPAALFDDDFVRGTAVGNPEGGRTSRVMRRIARWNGKAPHTSLHRVRSMPNVVTSISKSMMWDADWWRVRLCGDPMRMPTRVPYGRVYEPGCMDGFWQGRMVTPGQLELEALLRDPMRPDEFTEESLAVMFDFIFVKFREAHAVVGVNHGDDLGALLEREERGDGTDNDGDDAGETDDNMNNAWFAGEPGSTMFNIREGEGHRGGDNVEIAVTDEFGRVRRSVFPCWKRERIGRVEGGVGNDALGADGLISGSEESGQWTGHDHNELACNECLARRRIQQQLDRERAEEEARLIGKNGREAEGQSDEDEWSSNSDSSIVSYDTSLDEWDPSYGFETDPDGNEYPPLPPAHDRTKLAKGNCTGIEAIYLIGETPQRHGDAFNHFTYYGRVRMWDGLIAILRKPKHPRDAHLGTVLFYGHLVGGENFVGNWRITTMDPGLPAWEGAFVMSRRRD